MLDSKNRTDIIYLLRSVHGKGTKKDQSRGGRNQALSKKLDKEMKHVLQQHSKTEAKVYDIRAVESWVMENTRPALTICSLKNSTCTFTISAKETNNSTRGDCVPSSTLWASRLWDRISSTEHSLSSIRSKYSSDLILILCQICYFWRLK